MKEKIKVAFQGEKGAYSHLACLEIFPNAEILGMNGKLGEISEGAYADMLVLEGNPLDDVNILQENYLTALFIKLQLYYLKIQ